MKYVIERDGEFYGGYSEGRPVWLTHRRPETQFDADMAERIVQQLTALGFSGCVVKIFQARIRKKMPAPG